MTASVEQITEDTSLEMSSKALIIQGWAEGVLEVARHLDLSPSPEMVAKATEWGDANAVTDKSDDELIVDIAYSAGLIGQFVDITLSELSPLMLPALVRIDDHFFGVIKSVANGQTQLTVLAEGKSIERTVDTKLLMPRINGRILLLQAREKAGDNRLDDYLLAKPQSWLKGLFASNWSILFELGVGSMVSNLLAIGTALFAMQVWDRVVPARSINTLWVLAAGVMLALMLELLIKTIRVTLADQFGKQADLKLSAMFFARTLAIRNDARPRSPGTLISQLRDLEQVREFLTSTTLGLLIDIPFIVTFLVIIWLIGGYLVLVPIAAIPFLIIPGLLAQIPLSRLSKEGLEQGALRNAILMESIYRAEDIKSLQAEPRFRSQWNNINQFTSEVGMKQRRISALLTNFSQMVQQLAYVSVIVTGVYGILDDKLSFGAVLACSILTSRTIAPLGMIAGVLGRVQNMLVGKKALDMLLKLPTDNDPSRDVYHRPNLVGHYDFEKVVYKYGPEDKPALEIQSLKINAGERIALLGKVGAGKSTLLRLAAGLATPEQGRVLFNGSIMSMIDVGDVRRDIGVVMQESSLFYGSIRDNMLIANPRASDDQILEAMRLSMADSLLLNQPHGLDLKLREGGSGLSGGQKQALILARMFLRSPNVVVLDEPTASLDEMTEQAIIEKMRGWLGNRTMIVATHRYPVLSLVDRIIVIDNGRIVLDGPKDQVMNTLSGSSDKNSKRVQ